MRQRPLEEGAAARALKGRDRHPRPDLGTGRYHRRVDPGYFPLATAVAVELNHPAYDAVNLAVAEASELRLVTADDTLIHKAREGQSRFRHLLVALSEIA
jgi:hypothetical protein